MKALTLKIFAVSALLAASSMATAGNHLNPFYEKQLVKVCKAAKDNELGKLRRAVRETGMKYKTIQEDIRCNGMTLVDFAIEHNADKTAIFIAKKARMNRDVVIAKLNKASKPNPVINS